MFSLRAIFIFAFASLLGKVIKRLPPKPRLTLKFDAIDGFVSVELSEVGPNVFTITPPLSGHRSFDVPGFLTQHPEVVHIEFVFFMGLGDYIVGHNFFEIFNTQFPRLRLSAMVSNHADGNNSPLVADLLKENNLFDRVTFFEGRPAKFWKVYDYSDALRRTEPNTLVLPVIYQHDSENKSRVRSLCETFNIPRPSLIALPNLRLKEPSTDVDKYVGNLSKIIKGQHVIYVQLVGRSSRYEYPHSQQLIRQFIDLGYFVITADRQDFTHEKLIILDQNRFLISDSIKILKAVNKIATGLYAVTISSVGSAITAALNIPSIILQQKFDEAIYSVYFSNQWIVSTMRYEGLPDDRNVIVEQEPRDHGFEKIAYYDFLPEKIVELVIKIIGPKKSGKFK